MPHMMEVSRPEAEAWARGWRRLTLAAGMLVYPGITAASISSHSSGVAAVIGYIVVALFTAGYLVAMVLPGRIRAFWLVVGIMAALFVGELWIAQIDAFYLGAVVVSLTVVPLRGWSTPVVLAVAAAAIVLPVLIPAWHTGAGLTQAVMVVFTALIWFAFAEIARANRTLVEARAEVARLASEAERNRIARDLHDLVGHSLTAITVKSNLARRLAENEGSPTIREITEVELLSRQALADVRAAVSGYREVTLASELARARELLRASGIVADIPTATETTDSSAQELLGWAVREGVTNVVRHASATRCTVALSAAGVTITDDGNGSPSTEGNGLAGLRERADASGARVTAGPIAPRGWQLRVAFDGRPA